MVPKQIRVHRIIIVSLLMMYTLSCRLDSASPQTTQAAPWNTPVLEDSQAGDTMQAVPEHPRLFFSANDIATLRTQTQTSHAEIWAPIEAYVNAEMHARRARLTEHTEPPADENEDAFRNFGNRMLPLAFACVITENTDYCNLARDYLLTMVAMDQWDEEGKRDLGHSHILISSALAYDWLYRHLTPNQRVTIRTDLARRAQELYTASVEPITSDGDNWWQRSYIQNHYSTNHSAIGLAGLSLLGEDERAQIWITHANQRLTIWRDLLNNIGDGSWHEGIEYQSYSLTMTLPYLVNLRTLQGVDLFPHTYLQNYPYWRIYNSLSNGQFILSYGNFEWSWANSYDSQNILRFIAAAYNNGHSEWMAQKLIADFGRPINVWHVPWNVFEYLYYNPARVAEAPDDLPLSRTFLDLEAVIWRTGWSADDLVFGLKTGAYGGRFAFNSFTQGRYPWETSCVITDCEYNVGHEHNDINGFYLYQAEQWLVPERVGFEHSATSFHNTLLIDNQGQEQPPDNRQSPVGFLGSDGFLEVTTSTPDFNYVAADATRRYRNIPGIKDITRHVVFVRPDYFVMLDNIAAETAHTYDWISHFSTDVSVEGNWVRGNAGNGAVLGIAVARPQVFTFSTGNDGQSYIRIRPTTPTANLRFIHILYPTSDAAWDTRPAVTVLADTGEVAVVRVQANDGNEQSDDIVIRYGQTNGAISAGSYTFDGQIAVVCRQSATQIETIFLYGGTTLSDQQSGRVLIANADSREPFEVTFSENATLVAVNGSINTEVTLYAPQAQTLTLNGVTTPFRRNGDVIVFKRLEQPTSVPESVRDQRNIAVLTEL